MSGPPALSSVMLSSEATDECRGDSLLDLGACCSSSAPVLTAWDNQCRMKSRFASKAATVTPISSNSLRIVRQVSLSSEFRLSTV